MPNHPRRLAHAAASSAAELAVSCSGKPAGDLPRWRLTALLGGEGFLSRQAVAADGVSRFISPMAPKQPALPARAKSVIFLFMYGGPSHVDTFDHKPQLYGLDGKTIDVKTFGRSGKKNQGRVVGPKWAFRQHGQCGKYVSDVFPHLATCVDDMAFVHSMYADSPIHGSAMLMMNSGRIISGHPCLGSWVTYGLGSENENLPGFVVMLDSTGGPISGAKNWSSGYMPASFQGTVLRAGDVPIHDLAVPEGTDRATPPPAAGSPPRKERGPSRLTLGKLRASRADRGLRASLQNARVSARGGGFLSGDR